MVWLDATPDKLNQTRREIIGDRIEVPPDCDGIYLLDYLSECGPTMASGMGATPLTHGEIESWQRNIGITLNTWEARLMRKLSIDYLHQSNISNKVDCPSPYGNLQGLIIAKATQQSIRAISKL